jgi:hypothetical protein
MPNFLYLNVHNPIGIALFYALTSDTTLIAYCDYFAVSMVYVPLFRPTLVVVRIFVAREGGGCLGRGLIVGQGQWRIEGLISRKKGVERR